MNRCPECKDILVNSKNCKNCGWRKQQADTAIDRTCHCGRQGSLSDGTHGGGPWFCSEHFRPSNYAGIGGGVSGERGKELIEHVKTLIANKGLVQEEPGANG